MTTRKTLKDFLTNQLGVTQDSISYSIDSGGDAVDTGDDLGNERIRLETQKLRVIPEINNIVRNAQKVAELRLLTEAKTNPDLKHIPNAILFQQLTDERMKSGDVEGAAKLQKKEKETSQLLQMAK